MKRPELLHYYRSVVPHQLKGVKPPKPPSTLRVKKVAPLKLFAIFSLVVNLRNYFGPFIRIFM